MALAFSTPNELAPVLNEVQAVLSVGELFPPRGIREARISGEVLEFPYRTYYSTANLKHVISAFDKQAEMLCLALCSRHHDGHIRQWAITALDFSSYPWVPAFAVQLLGEYVVEVALVVEAKMARAGLSSFVPFCRENLAFLATTKRRATSYWDCYYRSDYSVLSAFPNYRAVHALQAEARAAA